MLTDKALQQAKPREKAYKLWDEKGVYRSMASTLLTERGWDEKPVELQLAHKPKNVVRATYNRWDYLAKKRVMVQEWHNVRQPLFTLVFPFEMGPAQNSGCLPQ